MPDKQDQPIGPQDDGQDDWEDTSPPGNKIGEVVEDLSKSDGNAPSPE